MSEVVFHERQRMLQPWALMVLTLVLVVLEAVTLMDYFEIVDVDDVDTLSVCVVTIIVALVTIGAVFLRLDVTVDGEYVTIKTVGTKRIPLADIEEAIVRDRAYAVRMFGGWGIRVWIRGVGYIAPGNDGGVEIRVKGAKHSIMISSMDPEALLRAIS